MLWVGRWRCFSSCFASRIMRCFPDPGSCFQSEVDRWEPHLWTLSAVGLYIVALHLEQRSGVFFAWGFGWRRDQTLFFIFFAWCETAKPPLLPTSSTSFQQDRCSLWCPPRDGFVIYRLHYEKKNALSVLLCPQTLNKYVFITVSSLEKISEPHVFFFIFLQWKWDVNSTYFCLQRPSQHSWGDLPTIYICSSSAMSVFQCDGFSKTDD